ncbi:hypothetical protein [Falsiroseomonas selenitidurans]|uniref:Uncharacterized protein n=1 Tax=Falsiroseomonas selenitidurans TaxID=2716335 RepID=A0ABX1E1U2_9PROT|nr:hypothetical protein [Falsiroseomonas selenitidurans]NKC31099.1 hypothetical protein [Falsiroseomonas selenitidurans]
MLDLGPGDGRFSRAADGGPMIGAFRTILLEIVSLFVHNGTPALALVVWCAPVGPPVLALSGGTMATAGATLMAGSAAWTSW